MGNASPERPRRRLRAALCAYFVFHMAAITMSNVSRTTALGTGFHRPFDWYLGITSLGQYWDMFTTVPRFVELDGALVASDAHGATTEYGPMLPGLKPYAKSGRVHAMFLRLAFSEEYFPGFGARYLAAVCRAVRERTGSAPSLVAFELRTKQLRPLSSVIQDGLIGEPKTFRFGPAPCGQ